MDSAPRKKTSRQGFARPADVGLAPRALDAQRLAPRSSRLPTAAALQVALVSSLLVAGGIVAGCAAGADEGIAADVSRRPAVRAADTGPHTTDTAAATATGTTAAPAVSAPIEPVPHAVKGEMAPVIPTVVAVKPPPVVKPPRTTGPTAPTIPRRLGGKPMSVLPTTVASTGAPALGSKPCDPALPPETY